ncbi:MULTISPECIES: urease accessory protein UreF [unclassified Aureimonas]|uniref:urease accessory protein UreF n=1 Tax=unclassified Aureimonas TaxID=2615206 RepID=UPI0006FF23A0|nr:MULTISPECIES: urease accessory protein UreF [unclassified Aureimonas]KQT69963.1 urease accessory protein UreF [Aureimonas sp. Leaf427]KQT75881.1 urease accessory protein UreF [Aureimonas sp. Leaf460]
MAAMTTEAAGDLSLLRLMTWLSPAFPIGAFAFSHGLESAIAERRITDGEGVADWIALLLTEGSGWNDLVLFAQAHQAASAGDAPRLRDLAELARALGGSAERRDETLSLGDAFQRSSAPWASAPADAVEGLAYPLAVAQLAARSGIALPQALGAFAHGFAANLVSAATRLVPLGQSAAMRALHRLEPVILSAAERAAASTPDDLGSSAILSDIAAMRHETLSTRLFRS